MSRCSRALFKKADEVAVTSTEVLLRRGRARERPESSFGDGLMGKGFNAWYLEIFVESAKEPTPNESPPLQLPLSGFESIGIRGGHPLHSI